MINRILIRVKVVQILYSYLLSRSEFNILQAPQAASRDRRFAYAVYLDMLYLIQELSGIAVNNPERNVETVAQYPFLVKNRVGRALADDPSLKAISFKELSDLNLMGAVLPKLARKVAESDYYVTYSRKHSRNLDNDVEMWVVMLETIISRDQELIHALRKNPEFTLSGFHAGVMMAVDTIREYNDSRAAYLKAKQELGQSLAKAYDLYIQLFTLIVALTQEEADRLEAAKNKYLATSDDLNPNTRFINNRFAEFIRQSLTVEDHLKEFPSPWEGRPALLKNLNEAIRGSHIYQKYMQADHSDWKSDCEFWRDTLRSVVLPSEPLAEELESESIFWNDDMEIVGTFALKTIRRFSQAEEGDDSIFLPPFKDEEDEKFGERLFGYAVDNRDTYREYIDKFINKEWDPDRLAFMDIVIMIVALAEIEHFPAIPVPVSLNEYIEIANTYSTHRSGPFINGILYSIVSMLSEEGKLDKPFKSDKN